MSSKLFCMHYVGNVIYHKFSHCDVSYKFNGENVDVMLEVLKHILLNKNRDHS